jgi:hypothetical protein
MPESKSGCIPPDFGIFFAEAAFCAAHSSVDKGSGRLGKDFTSFSYGDYVDAVCTQVHTDKNGG